MSASQHTPTPWTLEERGDYFNIRGADGALAADDGSAGGEYSAEMSRENAAFILRACNSHEVLVEAAGDLLRELRDARLSCAAAPALIAALKLAKP